LLRGYHFNTYDQSFDDATYAVQQIALGDVADWLGYGDSNNAVDIYNNESVTCPSKVRKLLKDAK